MVRHLFDAWDSFEKICADKALLLFLDYDGTLTPIVDMPEKALLSAETRSLLEGLVRQKNCKVALISGRSLADIKRLVGIPEIVYAGNHGLELEGPHLKHTFFEFRGFRALLDKVKTKLARVVDGFEGAFIEDKGLSLSLHFRLVDPKKLVALRTAVRETLIHFVVKGQVRVKKGKMVFEIRPPVRWDKGKVVLWLMSRWKFAFANKDAVPVYIGDDTTDEDAFAALKNNGLTVFVGKPDATAAKYYLLSHEEVKKFLRRLLKLPQAKR